MRKLWIFLLAIGLAGALPVWSWAQTEIVKTADGLSFKFGMIEKFVALTVQELDFVEASPATGGLGNFTSLTVPDVALGENKLAVHNYANLLFTLEKGPLSIHANLEMEATTDEAQIDVNNINLERISLTYKIPGLGALTAGADVHLFDPEGGLVYQDEDPGVWLVGSQGPLSWNLGWHLRSNGLRGTPLFSSSLGDAVTSIGTNGPAQRFDVSGNIYEVRLGYTVVPGTTISPFFLFYNRHRPQVDAFEFACPVGTSCSAPLTGGSGRSDQFRPGMVVTSALGPVTFTGEAAGLLGEIKGLNNFLGPAGTTEFDLRSFALFAELALDGKAIGTPGLTPFVNFEWQKGDGDPFDDKYGGYVPISNLSSALRKDGFNKQSISSFGPSPLGASAEAAWGFDVTSRGIGPTLGAIVPDETGATDGSTFNLLSRGGKAGNPGFFKVSGGVIGKVAPNWDTHLGVSAFWYDQKEAILAEAAQNCLARGLAPCGAGDPTNPTAVRNAMNALKGAGLFNDRFMGVEINGNIGYNINNFRFQPFFSVFVPSDVVDDILGAFLTPSGTIRPIDSKTAFTAGVEFRASF